MISVVIEAREGEEAALARTLASLVPAAVDGTVREAIVVDGRRSESIARVTDHAGCRVEQSLEGAVAAARGEWLLLLEPGARLMDGWGEIAAVHAAGGGRAARFSRDPSAGASLMQRFRARTRPLRRGLLIRRSEAATLKDGLGRLRLVTLPAHIVPAR